jgi:phosphoglucosamine mutase
MSSHLFGTDGIRAPFGTPPLTATTVTSLGTLLAQRLGGPAAHPLVLLGGDTRASTPTLTAWLAGGLTAGGAIVRHAGVVPTPALARLVVELEAAAAVAVSASHNLPPDNGIKLIAADGFKWPVSEERALEQELAATLSPAPELQAPPSAVPPVDPALARSYLAALAATVPAPRALAGLRIVLDCAHGAASPFAAELFSQLGANARVLHAAPDGHNINHQCGSTHPEALIAQVRTSGADLGIAFDGDADRAILVDHRGTLVDGDGILYVWAQALATRHRLPGRRIVATSMSNLGLEVALRRVGIGLVRCDVGDRHVVETMRREGVALGGEQSGHVVCLDLSTTGDGMLTALQVAAAVTASGRPLADLVAGFTRFPQLLRNVRVASKPPLETLPTLQATAREVTRRLGDEGRLVLRYSGTEPLCRIMLEGPDQPTIEAMADELAAALASELGAT